MEAALRAAEAKERREIKEFDEARESNPWLRRVKWQAHTAGLDAEKLRELVSPVGDDEPELQVLYKAFDWMIQNAQYTTVQEVVGQAALFEVNKKKAKQETQMPFDSWMDIQPFDHIPRCGDRFWVIFSVQRIPSQRTVQHIS
ncbi:hypothetical protein DL95DRAFT_104236 [Leptodontidium sp. 2 PMI_412]|nr:hypothetical protein DL95DRAFT_104236 [Leptodontidium sp. 2 PMI_412]